MPKVLVAEPSPAMRRMLELLFTRDGMQVVPVADGADIIEAIRLQRPDLVLADLAMPHRDGYEVVALVKADPALAAIPVLLMAGAFEPVDRERAAAAGSAGVVAKPFDPHQLVSRVRRLMAGGPAIEHADGYFERLSAALEARAHARPQVERAPRSAGEAEEGDFPTLDAVLRDDQS